MWKQYYKNYYISDKGEVKNINTGRILKQYITHQGYYRTNIRKENKTIAVFIHQAVASLFIPNPLNLPMINHKDGNKLNNEINNLEWCDASYNAQHAIEHNLMKPYGEDNGFSKLTNEAVIDIRTHYKKYSEEFGSNAFAKKYGISNVQVLNIVKYKNWNHL